METKVSLRKGRGRLLWLAVAASLALAWLSRDTTSNSVALLPNGGLVVDAADLNLGLVWEQERFEKTIRVKNPTACAIEVTRLYSSCTCTSVEPRSFVVEAGGETDVRLALDLRARDSGLAEDDGTAQSRDVQVELYPQVSTVPAKTEEWTLKAQVRKPLLVESEVIDFGDISTLQAQPSSKLVRVKCLSPVDSFSVSCDPTRADVEVAKGADGSDRDRVHITLAKNIPLGRFDFDLRLEPSSSNGTKMPAFPVRVTGRMVDDVQVFPAEVTFGSVDLGDRAEESVVLRSLSGRPFVVEAADATLDGVTFATSQQSNAPTTCRVMLEPAHVGAIAGRVQFDVVSGDVRMTIPLRVSYLGRAPRVQQVGRSAERGARSAERKS